MNRVEDAIQALKAGKMILLTDHPDRENEADLVCPAETMTAVGMNFIIRNSSGIVCLSLTQAHLDRLHLPLMVPSAHNTSRHGTPFSISIDAKEGISTGVSAADRVTTIQAALQADARPEDLVRPGHVFPLAAREGGVLERKGHTEGALDIVRLAGFTPAAVLCEVMDAAGQMMRGAALLEFASHSDLPLVSIEELVDHRLRFENQIQTEAKTALPLEGLGVFEIRIVKEKYRACEHLILSKPQKNRGRLPLVRIHSACTTGDIFASQRCDCHAQLRFSLEAIGKEGGMLIYLAQEGRGIGLFNKIKAYALQDLGLDTVEANLHLNLPADARQYYLAAQVLREKNWQAFRLLTNNPAKLEGLAKYGVTGAVREPMPIFRNAHNNRYLETKEFKLNHLIFNSEISYEQSPLCHCSQ